MTSPAAALSRWWFEPVPLGRIAAFRVLVYLFVPVDVALTQGWVRSHLGAGAELYQPLRIADLLHLPTPTTTSVTVLLVALLAFGPFVVLFVVVYVVRRRDIAEEAAERPERSEHPGADDRLV